MKHTSTQYTYETEFGVGTRIHWKSNHSDAGDGYMKIMEDKKITPLMNFNGYDGKQPHFSYSLFKREPASPGRTTTLVFQARIKLLFSELTDLWGQTTKKDYKTSSAG